MSSPTLRKVIGLPPAAHYRQLPAAAARLEEVCAQLARDLPRSLDVAVVLESFAEQSRQLVAFDAMQFSLDGNSPIYQSGNAIAESNTTSHQVGYLLEIGPQRLGELRISRARPFGETDLSVLETLMSLLGFPLRNALLYRDALQAARQDALTGVGNRAALNETLATELSLATRHGNRFSVLMLDVDHFKRINDSHGHAAGDEVLRAVAQRIAGLVRTTDAVFRYGGEEFAILLRNTDVTAAAILAERVRLAVECAPVRCNDIEVNVTISSGLTGYTAGSTAEQLLGTADEALYRAKQNGRNQVQIAA